MKKIFDKIKSVVKNNKKSKYFTLKINKNEEFLGEISYGIYQWK